MRVREIPFIIWLLLREEGFIKTPSWFIIIIFVFLVTATEALQLMCHSVSSVSFSSRLNVRRRHTFILIIPTITRVFFIVATFAYTTIRIIQLFVISGTDRDETPGTGVTHRLRTVTKDQKNGRENSKTDNSVVYGGGWTSAVPFIRAEVIFTDKSRCKLTG